MSEIMNYKGVAAGTTINWTFELIIGLISKPMFDHAEFGSYVFMLFGSLYIVTTTILCIFLKETKGLNEKEVQSLYESQSLATVFDEKSALKDEDNVELS
jgi:hypothetical protein